MQHPYQCFALGNTGQSHNENILLAANRSHVYAFDIISGTFLSSWPELAQEDPEEIPSSPEIITGSNDGDFPARKRKRVSKSQRLNGKDAHRPTITKLVSSSDGRFIVVVTGEDKSVHVLKIAEDGVLVYLSQRRMTKRPCALTVVSAADEPDYILCGDKFGDVYAMPLLFEHRNEVIKDQPGENGQSPALKAFKPSATTLTVHTAKNRKALEAQLRDENQRPKPKEKIEFEHELLLGHVSMLTDLAAVTLEERIANPSNGEPIATKKDYLLTADRDEHIRVSRGRPQSHIIENFCFGHTQFVNKLCLVKPTLLISGGGDDFLFIWNWRLGQLLEKIDLRRSVGKYWKTQALDTRRSKFVWKQATDYEHKLSADSANICKNRTNADLVGVDSAEQMEEEPIAVIGIWSRKQETSAVPLPQEELASESGGLASYEQDTSFDIFCGCEGIPALFRFRCENYAKLGDGSGHIFKEDILPLKGNPLDVAIVSSKLLVTVDCVHEPGKPIMLRSDTVWNQSLLKVQEFSLDESGSESSGEFSALDPGSDLTQSLNRAPVSTVHVDGSDLKSLQDILYGTEHLRKHAVEDVVED